jgi:hypothetical protein
MDSTSRDILTDQKINMEETWFDLSPKQQASYEKLRKLNEHIRENYHELHSAIWYSTKLFPQSPLVERELIPARARDACRIHGTFELNKISGNFHIITGKSISFFGNHAHLTNIFDVGPKNFSHRIDHFSFGEINIDLMIPNALNYELKVAKDSSMSYQYFVSVVATKADDKIAYQYSATERVSQLYLTLLKRSSNYFFNYY